MKKIYTHLFPFIALAITSFLGTKNPTLAFAALSVLGVIMLSINFKKGKLILFLVASLFGPIAEAIAIYFGQWNYTHVDLFNVPFWLAPLWGCAALYIQSLGERLGKRFN